MTTPYSLPSVILDELPLFGELTGRSDMVARTNHLAGPDGFELVGLVVLACADGPVWFPSYQMEAFGFFSCQLQYPSCFFRKAVESVNVLPGVFPLPARSKHFQYTAIPDWP